MKEDFVFIEEIKKSYNKIIPKEEHGMIIFSLFDKYDTKVFSEKELKRTISDFHNYHEKERELHTKIKSTIQFLTLNFIRKSKQGYILTSYAQQFTKEIIKKIERDFSPSDVQKILLKLKNELSEQKDNFNDWVDFFERYKTDLDNQIESLNTKIDRYVIEFRTIIFNNKTKNINLLKSIREGLEKIKNQVIELSSAFSDILDIEDLLNQVKIIDEPELTLENKKKARLYFEDIRDYLNFINKRIDLIQPRVQEFFSDISRADFDKKTKKFIRFLVKNTTVEKNKSKIELKFPCDNVFVKTIYSEKFNFTITDNQLKKGKEQSKIENTVIKTKEVNKQFEKAQNIRKTKVKIYKYVSEIKTDLDKNNVIEYAPYFYKILNETQNINIAIKVAYLLLNEFSKSTLYDIKINDVAIINQANKNMALWQMKIIKKK